MAHKSFTAIDTSEKLSLIFCDKIKLRETPKASNTKIIMKIIIGQDYTCVW